MKRDLKSKVLFGISALSLVSGFNASGTGSSFKEDQISKKPFCEKVTETKLENTKDKENNKNKLLLPKIKKILKAVPKLVVSYSVSAIASLFTLYITDKVSSKLLNIKATEYFSNLLK